MAGRTGSLSLNPRTLQTFRPGAGATPNRPAPPFPGGGGPGLSRYPNIPTLPPGGMPGAFSPGAPLDPNIPGHWLPPGILGGQRGMSPGPQSMNPFGGNRNPGAFTTPAPFSPQRALMIPGLQPRAGLLPSVGRGGFGMAPKSQQPRSRNPFWSPR